MKASELRATLGRHKLTGKQAAEELGISLRMLRYYTSETNSKPIPKKIELALEAIINKML